MADDWYWFFVGFFSFLRWLSKNSFKFPSMHCWRWISFSSLSLSIYLCLFLSLTHSPLMFRLFFFPLPTPIHFHRWSHSTSPLFFLSFSISLSSSFFFLKWFSDNEECVHRTTTSVKLFVLFLLSTETNLQCWKKHEHTIIRFKFHAPSIVGPHLNSSHQSNLPRASIQLTI